MAPPTHTADLLTAILAGAVDDPAAVAATLIDDFGTLGQVLAASRKRLARIAGDGAATRIAAIDAAVRQTLFDRASERPIVTDWQALLDYARGTLQHLRTEQVRLLHLDGRNKLIRDELLSAGTIDEATLYVREVISRSLEIGSAAIILLHNHPSGDPTPSRSDIAITRTIKAAAEACRITLHDHLIVATSGHFSLRAHGYI